MTKQEEIREVLDGLRFGDLITYEALRELGILGVVIKVEHTCGQCIRGFTNSVHSGNSSFCPVCHGRYKTLTYESIIGE